MEQLYYVLTQVSDLPQVNQYIQEQYSNLDFGNVLFQILQNDSPESIHHNDSIFISKICFILKQWAKMNWGNMIIDQRAQYFDSLKKLILSIHEPHVKYLSDSFTDMADREYQNKKDGNLEIFKIHYNDFFNVLSTPQNYSTEQLIALLEIIVFASRTYKKARKDVDPSEPSVFLTKITENVLPYLENLHLLETSEGCKILGLVLQSFRISFMMVKPPIENASVPLSFSENVETEFIKRNISNSQIVCAAVCFLKHFYTSSYRKDYFDAGAPQILQKHFELLSVALEFKIQDGYPDYYLISKILDVISQFIEIITPDQNIIDILLESAKLTRDDIENFRSNPDIFYFEVYQRTHTNSKNNSSRLARSIIAHFCSNNEASINIISYLISLPPSENVIRCLGICIKASEGDDKDNPIMIPLPPNIVPYYMDLLQNPVYHQDPTLMASIFDFIRYLVPHLEIEQNSEIMNVLPQYFMKYKDSSILTVMLTRLLKNLIKNDIYPFDKAIDVIIRSLEISFTKHALKCVKLMNDISKEAVIPYSDFVLGGIFESITNSFRYIKGEEEDDNDAIDKQDMEMENIRSNLELCSGLINETGAYLVKPYFLEIVKNIFEYDEDADLIDSVVDLLTSIFGSGTQLIPEFIKLIIEASQNYPWDNQAYYIIKPLFKLISSNPQIIVELNICNYLGEFSMKMLTNQGFNDQGNYLYFGTLLSWIIILDSKNNREIGESAIQNIFQCGLTICTMENAPIQSISAFLEVLASISVSYGIFPGEEIIGLMVNAVKSNWILRICQKQLYIIFFLSLANSQKEVADSAVQVAFDLMNKMNEQQSAEDEEEYLQEIGYPQELDYLATLPFPFKSPIEEFPIKQLTQSALQFCQQETIDNIHANFPGILQQFNELQQQNE